jgi:hypothetical protein
VRAASSAAARLSSGDSRSRTIDIYVSRLYPACAAGDTIWGGR